MAHGRRCSDLRGRGDGGDSADPAGDERQVAKAADLNDEEGDEGEFRIPRAILQAVPASDAIG
jgi:hypothetical protein